MEPGISHSQSKPSIEQILESIRVSMVHLEEKVFAMGETLVQLQQDYTEDIREMT